MLLRTSVGPNPQIKFICFQQSQSLWYIAPLIHLHALNFSVLFIQPMNPLSDSDPLSALSVYPVRQVIGSPVLHSPKFRYRFIYLPVILLPLVENFVLIVHNNWYCCLWCKIIVSRCHSARRHKKALLMFGSSIRVCSNRCRYMTELRVEES